MKKPSFNTDDICTQAYVEVVNSQTADNYDICTRTYIDDRDERTLTNTDDVCTQAFVEEPKQESKSSVGGATVKSGKSGLSRGASRRITVVGVEEPKMDPGENVGSNSRRRRTAATENMDLQEGESFEVNKSKPGHHVQLQVGKEENVAKPSVEKIKEDGHAPTRKSSRKGGKEVVKNVVEKRTTREKPSKPQADMNAVVLNTASKTLTGKFDKNANFDEVATQVFAEGHRTVAATTARVEKDTNTNELATQVFNDDDQYTVSSSLMVESVHQVATQVYDDTTMKRPSKLSRSSNVLPTIPVADMANVRKSVNSDEMETQVYKEPLPKKLKRETCERTKKSVNTDEMETQVYEEPLPKKSKRQTCEPTKKSLARKSTNTDEIETQVYDDLVTNTSHIDDGVSAEPRVKEEKSKSKRLRKSTKNTVPESVKIPWTKNMDSPVKEMSKHLKVVIIPHVPVASELAETLTKEILSTLAITDSAVPCEKSKTKRYVKKSASTDEEPAHSSKCNIFAAADVESVNLLDVPIVLPTETPSKRQRLSMRHSQAIVVTQVDLSVVGQVRVGQEVGKEISNTTTTTIDNAARQVLEVDESKNVLPNQTKGVEKQRRGRLATKEFSDEMDHSKEVNTASEERSKVHSCMTADMPVQTVAKAIINNPSTPGTDHIAIVYPAAKDISKPQMETNRERLRGRKSKAVVSELATDVELPPDQANHRKVPLKKKPKEDDGHSADDEKIDVTTRSKFLADDSVEVERGKTDVKSRRVSTRENKGQPRVHDDEIMIGIRKRSISASQESSTTHESLSSYSNSSKRKDIEATAGSSKDGLAVIKLYSRSRQESETTTDDSGISKITTEKRKPRSGIARLRQESGATTDDSELSKIEIMAKPKSRTSKVESSTIRPPSKNHEVLSSSSLDSDAAVEANTSKADKKNAKSRTSRKRDQVKSVQSSTGKQPAESSKVGEISKLSKESKQSRSKSSDDSDHSHPMETNTLAALGPQKGTHL